MRSKIWPSKILRHTHKISSRSGDRSTSISKVGTWLISRPSAAVAKFRFTGGSHLSGSDRKQRSLTSLDVDAASATVSDARASKYAKEIAGATASGSNRSERLNDRDTEAKSLARSLTPDEVFLQPMTIFRNKGVADFGEALLCLAEVLVQADLKNCVHRGVIEA